MVSEVEPLTPHPEMHYAYVLKDIETAELYYGFTNDLQRRVCEHYNKNPRWGLIYYEAYKAEFDARNRERRLKNYAQALTVLKIRLEGSLK